MSNMSPRPPQPYVVEVDELGNEILGSKRSATKVTKVPTAQRKRRILRGLRVVEDHKSKGSLEDAVKEHTGLDPMTILSGNCHEDSQAAAEGLKYRKLFCADKVIVKQDDHQTTTHVERQVSVPNSCKNQNGLVLFMEQRVLDSGQKSTIIRECNLPGGLNAYTDYVVKQGGDEMPSVGKTDLHINLRMLPHDEWIKYVKENAKYYGYDKEISVYLSQEDIKTKTIYFSLNPVNMGMTKNKPKSGSYLSNIQLQDLLFGKLARNEVSDGGKAVELFSLTQAGYGEQSEDGIYTGDLIHRIFAKI